MCRRVCAMTLSSVFCERVDDVIREALDIKLNVAQVNAAA